MLIRDRDDLCEQANLILQKFNDVRDTIDGFIPKIRALTDFEMRYESRQASILLTNSAEFLCQEFLIKDELTREKI